MDKHQESYERGLEVRRKLGIGVTPGPGQDEQHFRRSTEVLFGDVWGDDRVMSIQERSLITMACLVALGGVEEQLRMHIRGSRRLGTSQEKIYALINHLAFYAGFPKASAARRIATEVFKQEQQER